MAPSQLALTDRYRPRTSRAFVENVVSAVLAHVRRPDLEVSLLLTDDEEIARIHAEFCNDPTPTDVLSFAIDESVDVVVSVECARRQARALGNTIRAEIALYVVHGILHACGYDDHDARDRSRMRDAERAILSRLGLRARDVDV